MRKFVTESLAEFMKMNEGASTVSGTGTPQSGKAEKVAETPEAKAKAAIASLKKQLVDAKKPGKLNATSIQKKAQIKDIESKIAKWEAKLKKK